MHILISEGNSLIEFTSCGKVQVCLSKQQNRGKPRIVISKLGARTALDCSFYTSTLIFIHRLQNYVETLIAAFFLETSSLSLQLLQNNFETLIAANVEAFPFSLHPLQDLVCFSFQSFRLGLSTNMMFVSRL